MLSLKDFRSVQIAEKDLLIKGGDHITWEGEMEFGGVYRHICDIYIDVLEREICNVLDDW